MEINEVTQTIIGCAMRVHRALGPGLLESAYHRCLVHELEQFDVMVESEVSLPICPFIERNCCRIGN
jgi:GxxExxY protein